MSKPVRIPQPLYERVEALAHEEARSVANMVAVLLEQALAVDDELRTKTKTTILDPDADAFVQVSAPTTLKSERRADEHFKPDFKEKRK